MFCLYWSVISGQETRGVGYDEHKGPLLDLKKQGCCRYVAYNVTFQLTGPSYLITFLRLNDHMGKLFKRLISADTAVVAAICCLWVFNKQSWCKRLEYVLKCKVQQMPFISEINCWINCFLSWWGVYKKKLLKCSWFCFHHIAPWVHTCILYNWISVLRIGMKQAWPNLFLKV